MALLKPVVMLLVFGTAVLASVGFQQVTVPDPQGQPLAVGIWYPSKAPASEQTLEVFKQTVAVNGPVEGRRLPLVMMSHGVGGSLASHYDTAIALAESGFVAAAVTHTGDNSQDQSRVGNWIDLTDRPRQLQRVLDYLLESWPQRDRLDPKRIGVFGFSLGGFTALVAAGGTPDLSQVAKFCAERPDAPECVFVRQRKGDQLGPVPKERVKWAHDWRIKAVVVAAPAVVFLFGDEGLRGIRAPLQLWRAAEDAQAPDEWNSKLVRTRIAPPPEEHVVPGAGHMSFRPCSAALERIVAWVCEDAPGFDRVAFHVEFNRLVVGFFRTHL